MDIHRSIPKKRQIQQPNIKKKKSSRLRAHISRQNKRLSTIENNNISNIISSSLASDAKPNEVKVFKGSEVNLRSLLGAFMIGTGAIDIARFMTMVGVGGGSAFERHFYSYQAEACGVILDRCHKIVRASMPEETVLIMREQLEGKIAENLLNQYEIFIKNDELNKLPNDLPNIKLSISYDMGWQKRSGGRVYDSLSGHGFFIGCRSNKVIDFGVLKKMHNLFYFEPHK